MAFVPLFCRSHFSPLGVSSCSDLVRRARALGYATLGLCDVATMGGFHEFDSVCRAQGIRPVFGCRIEVEGLVLTHRRFPLDFLIESEQGHRNMVRLLTRRNATGPSATGVGEAPTRTKLSLRARSMGLRLVVPPDGELAELIRLKNKRGTEEFLMLALEAFGERLLIGTDAFADEPEIAPMLRRVAAFIHVKAIAAPVVHYAEPAEAPAAQFLAHAEKPPTRGWKPPKDTASLRAIFGEAETAGRFADDEDALHETGEVARRCVWRPAVMRRIMPMPDFERGFDANSWLFDLVIKGATRRYGEINSGLKQRINAEFEQVKARDLAPYLLLYREIAQHLDERGVSRGVGRGSVVSSLLAYCLGITAIDPVQYCLTSRPLADESESYPPLRVEIPSSEVPELIEWLRATFGERHVARIGRRTEARRRELLDELADWAHMTEEERTQAYKESSARRGAGALQSLRRLAEEGRSRRWRDPAFLADLATHLAPRPRAIVAAPGKWTISSEPLEQIIPTVSAPGEPPLTDIGEDAIDAMGAPRLEFAPHHLLNLLDRARLAARERSPDFALGRIDLDDRPTFDLIARGDTIGIPPLQSITMKALLRRRRPETILKLLSVKTEAASGRATQKPRELIDELPDVLLSYRCAYLKTHFPRAFFAGALSSAAETGDGIVPLVRAVRRAGIEILPPDINLSSAMCAVQGGQVRLGLRMIRRLGQKAWDEIKRVRQSGRFNTLTDFCERMSPRIINHRLLQNLISAGAFDGFGSNRAAMSIEASRLQRRSSAAGPAAEDTGSGQFTLFDSESFEPAKEPEPNLESELQDAEEVPDWDWLETARREAEALGFEVSIDPLDRYPETLRCLKPLDPDAINARLVGRQIRLAGIIHHIEDEGPLIGEERGTVVDLEGVAVWLSAEVAGLAHGDPRPQEEVFVMGEVTDADGYLRIEAIGLWLLEDIEAQSERIGRIRLDLEDEHKETIARLDRLVRDFPGTSVIEISGPASGRSWAVRKLAKRRVFFCSPFYQALSKIISLERVQILDHHDEPLSIAMRATEPAETAAGQ